MSMKRLSPVLVEADEEWCASKGKTLLHWCPGCKSLHPINVEKPNSWNAQWLWDGNVEQPTFNPSINIVGRCHYFIHGGQIKYQGDCTHSLAGQTVPLPPIPEDRL